MILKINTDDVHPEFVEGYMDGRDINCPEPNANRSERYKHSFAIGRNEIIGKKNPSYRISMSNAEIADLKEKQRS